MNPDTWNVLHDGRVVAARRDGDCIILIVRIEYLCGELPTAGDTLTLTLHGCDRFRWAGYDEPPTDDPARMPDRAEIIGAVAQGDGLGVDGCYGELAVRYTSATVATAEGQMLAQAELEAAAGRYWRKWAERNNP